MKNKIAKKLFFSAVALGASVLTLTTTTYAWYVQNNTVTATNISGATKSNDAGSLFITKDGTGTTPTWGPTIKFEDSDFNQSAGQALGNAKGNLVPLKLLNTNNDKDSFSDVAGNKNLADDATASISKGKVITVAFWLMSSRAGVEIQPTLMLKNTTGDEGSSAVKTTQTAYSAVKKTDGTDLVTQGSQFWVDAAQALRMSVVVTPDGSDPGTPSVYDVMAIAKSIDDKTVAYTVKGDSIKETDLGKDVIQVGDSTQELYGAHAFYQRFVGKAPTAGYGAGVTATSTWAPFTLGTTKTKFTVTFWLEGTDISCFDSCANQSFDFAFDFTVVQNS